MIIKKGSEATFEKGDAARFTGEVHLDPGLAAPNGSGNVVVVHFSPGARTHWHTHPGGQYLYGLSGRGWVRSRDEAGVALLPGDILYVEPGEEHFHGGTLETSLVHFAVNGGGAPEWGDAVDDEEYRKGMPAPR